MKNLLFVLILVGLTSCRDSAPEQPNTKEWSEKILEEHFSKGLVSSIDGLRSFGRDGLTGGTIRFELEFSPTVLEKALSEGGFIPKDLGEKELEYYRDTFDLGESVKLFESESGGDFLHLCLSENPDKIFIFITSY